MSVADCICIEGLRVEALVGAYAWERELRQPLVLDVRLGHDNRAVATLDTALDYAQVTQALRQHIGSRDDALLETLAESCCAMLAARFAPRWIELRINKPMAAAALGCAHVGVCLRRDYA